MGVDVVENFVTVLHQQFRLLLHYDHAGQVHASFLVHRRFLLALRPFLAGFHALQGHDGPYHAAVFHDQTLILDRFFAQTFLSLFTDNVFCFGAAPSNLIAPVIEPPPLTLPAL